MRPGADNWPNMGGEEGESVYEVRIVKATFAKGLHYFVSVQLNDGEKLRTEVAELSAKPEFRNGVFRLRRNRNDEASLKLAAFMIRDKDDGNKPSMLGTGEVDILALWDQLEGGKTVLCDDVPLRRKSKKPGQEDKYVTVGKLQVKVSIFAKGSRNTLAQAPSHPETRLCKLMIREIQDANLGHLGPEIRIISRKTMQAIHLWREDPLNSSELARYVQNYSSSMGGVGRTREEDGRVFRSESNIVEVEPRALENDHLLRVDFVKLEKSNQNDTGFDLNTWGTQAGFVIALQQLKPMIQYNLTFRFSDHLNAKASIELQPSFKASKDQFLVQEGLKRVHVHINSVEDSANEFEGKELFVRVSGKEAKENECSIFTECPLLPGSVPANELVVALESLDGDARGKFSKISCNACGQNGLFVYDSIMEFDADEANFSSFMWLEVFDAENNNILGSAKIEICALGQNGSLHTFDDILLSESNLKCNLTLRIWDGERFLKYLGNEIEAKPSGLPMESSRSIVERKVTGIDKAAVVPSLPLDGAKEGVDSRIEKDNEKKSSPRLEDRSGYFESHDARTPELTPGGGEGEGEEEFDDQLGNSEGLKAHLEELEQKHKEEEQIRKIMEEDSRKKNQLLQERLGVMTSDLSNKQILIDRLLEEVDKRAEAIRSCGAEIVQLRKANVILAEERDAALAKIREIEENSVREAHALAENAQEIENLEDLRRRLSLLDKKYAAEKERNKGIVKRLETLQQIARKHQVLAEEHNKLSTAHQSQSRYIQEMQEENAQMQIFQATIKTQEKVILKLEDLLESKLKENSGTTDQLAMEREIERLQKRNEELQEKLVSSALGESEGALLKKVEELENEISNYHRDGGTMSAPKGNEAERMQALEEQLILNAKKFAKEISEVRMKLFEYEAILEAQDIPLS